MLSRAITKIVIKQENLKSGKFFIIVYFETEEICNYAFMHSNGMLFKFATDKNGEPTGWFDTTEEAQKILKECWSNLKYEIEYSCVHSTPTDR